MIPLPAFGTVPGTVLESEANVGSPIPGENQSVIPDFQPMFAHYPGDVFLPGAGSWVYEPRTERTPLQTTWGNGFLVGFADYFKVFQPPQVYASPTVVQNGLGGLFAGQIVGQPLLYDSDVNQVEQGTTYALNGVSESGT